jgi:HSP20 family protein
MEIFENDSDIIAKAELPGLTKDDITIDLKDSVLTISGEKKQSEIEPNTRYHRSEISYGSFERSFHLASDVNTEKIAATFKDGILTIIVPKIEPNEGKTTIEIH